MHRIIPNPLELVFPSRCSGCGAWFTSLCLECLSVVEYASPSLAASLSLEHIDRVHIACRYLFPIREVLRDYKYHCLIEYADVCAQIMYYSCTLPPAALIVPVPTTGERRRWRGFNQTEQIAQALCQYLPSCRVFDCLQKKATPPLAGKDREERHDLMRQSIRLRTLPSQPVAQTILLLDDILTTGTTLEACADLLKKAGCTRVEAAVLAHGS